MLGCSACVSALAALIVVLIRNHLGRIFVNDVHVEALVAIIAPFAACNFILDGTQAAAGGVLRYCPKYCPLLLGALAGWSKTLVKVMRQYRHLP